MAWLLRKTFCLFPGEGRNLFRFVRFALFWALSSNCLEVLTDGLFIEKVGAHSLPLVFLCAASGMILSSVFIIRNIRSSDSYHILMTVMKIGAVCSFGVILFFLHNPPPWFWYAIKIFSRIFFSVFLACGWTFIDQYHNFQNAKRVYSIYSSSYFFGIVLSGILIHFLLQPLGHLSLFILSFSSLCLAIMEAKKIYRKIPLIEESCSKTLLQTPSSAQKKEKAIPALLKELLSSPYTLSLLALSLVTSLVEILSAFNYMESLENIFRSGGLPSHKDPTTFLGECRGFISLGNILLCAFFYGPTVRKFGPNNLAMITPLSFMFIYSQWMFSESLMIAILGIIAVEGVLFVFEDNSFNLLTKVVPSSLKPKVRLINDSFFEPIGMLMSSFFLFAIPNHSIKMGLILSCILLSITLIVRFFYKKRLQPTYSTPQLPETAALERQ